MKRFVTLALSLSLITGTVSPIGFNQLEINAQKKEEDDELISSNLLSEESLKIELDGEDEINLTSSDTEIELTLSKHPSLQNMTSILLLPKGISYAGNDQHISFNEETNELTIQLGDEDSEINVLLTLDHRLLNKEETYLQATIQDDYHEHISNKFKITISEDKVENIEEEKEAPSSIMKEQATETNPIPLQKNAAPTKSTKTAKTVANNGMSTLAGVPNANKPKTITYADPEKANEVDVSTWNELIAAMRNQSINVIHLQADFYNNIGTGRVNFNDGKYLSRNIQVNGNGHIVDFRGTVFYNNYNVLKDHHVTWEFNNMTMYGSDYYGPFQTSSNTSQANTSGNLVYNDVTYIGAQLTASYFFTILFGGNIENHSVKSYISPFTNARVNASSEENLQAEQLIFKKDARYNGTTDNRRVFELSRSGTMTVEENAQVEVTGIGGGDVIYLEGILTMKENANLIINSNGVGNQIAINIYGNDNGIKASKNSTIKINSNSPGGNVIDMANRTFIHVDDGASLDIQTNNRGYNSSQLISVGNNAEFIIGERGIFNAVSDGSGNHNLLRFGTGSKFQFANAELVNLQYTNPSLYGNTAMVYMANGTLDVDVQEVQAWNKTNIATNSERDADYNWTPMFGMITNFSGVTTKINRSESVMSAEKEKYDNEFKPNTFSRLQYSYIEDVRIGILNKPNDNVDSVDSTIIQGVANPGAYVRLSGDDALPEATIPSIVDGSDNPQLTDDFTVIADEDGTFTVHAKAGEHFTAANTIKAYAFLGGKMEEVTFDVLDKTSPTAEGKNLTMADGTDLPTAKKFVTNEADTNPANKGYTYEFKEDYSHLATEAGTHPIVVVLMDDAGNKREIPASLEVVADAFVIEAKGFTVNVSDLKKYNTTEKLNNYLLEQSKANAYGIIDFEKQDLTADLTVKSTSSIEDFKKGKYAVALELISEGNAYEKIFTVTVLNDEAVAPTNPEKPSTGEEPKEQENTGTGQNGLLKLDYAPSKFDFGTLKFGFDTAETNAIKTASQKQWLQVSDDRGEDDLTNWSIQVAQNHTLKNKEDEELQGATITLPKGTIYTENALGQENLTSEKVAITSTPTTVFSADVQDNTKGISTNVWDATDVKLNIPGNQEFKETAYSNKITWTLVSEPEDDQ